MEMVPGSRPPVLRAPSTSPSDDVPDDRHSRMLREVLQGVNCLQDAMRRLEDRVNMATQYDVDLESNLSRPGDGGSTRLASNSGLFSGGAPHELAKYDLPRWSLREEENRIAEKAYQLRNSGGSGASAAGIGTTTSTSTLTRLQILHRRKRLVSVSSESSNTQHNRVRHGASALVIDAALASQLGHSWPASIAVREDLQGDLDIKAMDKYSMVLQNFPEPGTSTRNTRRRSVSIVIGQGSLQYQLGNGINRGHSGQGAACEVQLPLDPDSTPVFLADMVRFTVLLYDILLTPFVLAWNVEIQGGLVALAWMSALYWVFDCMLNFGTGFYLNGDLVMDWYSIARHYSQTWLIPDLCLLISDWVIIGVDSIGKKETSLRIVLNVARGIRTIKLLRLAKVIVLMNTIASRLLSRKGAMRAQLLKIPFALLVYNHFVCCLWGLIGRHESECDDGWMVAPMSHSLLTPFRDMSYSSQYLAALHWTIAQMTPGPIDIVAGTNLERAFNCGVLVAGVLYGSMIVSQFSGHIMQITVLQRDKMQKLDAVRLFLKQRNVRRGLALRVQKQVHQRLFKEVPLQVDDVQAFDLLSTTLRQELLHELRLPPLLTHGLFRILFSVDPMGVKDLCITALDFTYLSPQDQLFAPGADSHAAYLVINRGCLNYIQEPGFSLVTERSETRVKANTWFCEASLWSYWKHVGNMEAIENTELMVFYSHGFMDELHKGGPGVHMLKHYGRGFHLRITMAVPPYADWPTDLEVPFTDMSNLVSTRVGIGLLHTAMKHNQLILDEDTHRLLINELLEEKCCLKTCEDGSLARMVSVVALQLRNADEEVLLELARVEHRRGGGANEHGRGIVAHAKLPGMKRGSNEVLQLALQRLLEKRLPGVAGSMVLEKSRIEVVQRDSHAYGMPTIYQRVVHEAFLDGELETTSWYKIPLEIDWLGITSLHRVDDEKGFYIYAWVMQSVLAELEDSDIAVHRLQEWFDGVDPGRLERHSFFYVDDLEV